jgi:excisionase family DNA binding protein
MIDFTTEEVHEEDPFLYTIPEAAEVLACSKPHVYMLISTGHLQAVDIALPWSKRTKLRIRSEDMETFLEQNLTYRPSDGGYNKKDPVQQETAAPGHTT